MRRTYALSPVLTYRWLAEYVRIVQIPCLNGKLVRMIDTPLQPRHNSSTSASHNSLYPLSSLLCCVCKKCGSPQNGLDLMGLLWFRCSIKLLVETLAQSASGSYGGTYFCWLLHFSTKMQVAALNVYGALSVASLMLCTAAAATLTAKRAFAARQLCVVVAVERTPAQSHRFWSPYRPSTCRLSFFSRKYM